MGVLTATGRSNYAAQVGDRPRVRNAVIVWAGDDDGHAVEVARWDRRRNLPLERARMPWIGECRPRHEEPGVDQVAGEEHHRRKQEVGGNSDPAVETDERRIIGGNSTRQVEEAGKEQGEEGRVEGDEHQADVE